MRRRPRGLGTRYPAYVGCEEAIRRFEHAGFAHGIDVEVDEAYYSAEEDI